VYASNTFAEYWAESTQAYFDANNGPGDSPDRWSRAQLQSQNPSMFALLDRVYNQSTKSPRCPTASRGWESGATVLDCSNFWQGHAGPRDLTTHPWDDSQVCGVVSEAPVECADSSLFCAAWKAEGRCDGSSGAPEVAWMHERCAKTCDRCRSTNTDLAEATRPIHWEDCVDIVGGCASADCSVFSNAMQCEKSCPRDDGSKNCAARTAAGECETDSEKMILECPTSCRRDLNASCATWAAADACHTHQAFMYTHCRASCEVCPIHEVAIAIKEVHNHRHHH
jgi:hypothetical protein